MRILVVGRLEARAQLKAELEQAGIEVTGEFDTLAAARNSGIAADATMIAGDGARRRREFEEPLTSREIEVLEQLAEGLPNKAIAERLGISDQTVKFHVASICGKLAASNRTDAVRKAIRRGWITV
jgi:DNA-binding NarL/FixJ family response regulator